MKIKDIEKKTIGISNTEAIKFLYFLFDWYGKYFDSINISYCDDEWLDVNFDSIKEAKAFIDDLELEQLDTITCDFKTRDFADSDITRYEITFDYEKFGPSFCAVINVIPKNFKNVDSEE